MSHKQAAFRFSHYYALTSSLTSAVDAGIKIRPDEEDLKEIGPEFEKRWKEHFANAPDKPVMWFGPFTA